MECDDCIVVPERISRTAGWFACGWCTVSRWREISMLASSWVLSIKACWVAQAWCQLYFWFARVAAYRTWPLGRAEASVGVQFVAR